MEIRYDVILKYTDEINIKLGQKFKLSNANILGLTDKNMKKLNIAIK